MPTLRSTIRIANLILGGKTSEIEQNCFDQLNGLPSRLKVRIVIGRCAATCNNVKDIIALFDNCFNAKAFLAAKRVNRDLLNYEPQGKAHIRFLNLPTVRHARTARGRFWLWDGSCAVKTIDLKASV